jgi:hypothetical protein
MDHECSILPRLTADFRPPPAYRDGAAWGCHVWRRLLYLVLTVEAALLAAGLFVLVIDPDIVLSPRERQLCAIGAVALGAGCCCALVCWLRLVFARWEWLNL